MLGRVKGFGVKLLIRREAFLFGFPAHRVSPGVSKPIATPSLDDSGPACVCQVSSSARILGFQAAKPRRLEDQNLEDAIEARSCDFAALSRHRRKARSQSRREYKNGPHSCVSQETDRRTYVFYLNEITSFHKKHIKSNMPRYAMFVVASAETEKMPPDPAMLKAMGAFNDSLRAAGVLLSLDGLRDTSVESYRVTYSEGGADPTVAPGPFDVDKGQGTVAGWWVIQVDGVEKALAWAKKVPFTSGQVEVRRVAEQEDLPEH